ncbi:hypothetical protein OIU76_018017 [Salix suchowensis]|uniref:PECTINESTERASE n=1 Tax=Salix koriyanagi TaxID=2511006 RepID=A0A9Q0Q7M3_9ROSI|nr:invertase/pectin methylesterase inhibitor family protein [Salix suchowensis]KAJ6308352.1 hypothetical protein OIU76_018017 [Salix suchowensis]KAJ6701483.1 PECTINESTERASE [Salix koriyanagi]
MKPITSFALLSLTLSLTLSLHASVASADTNLIEKVCARSHNKNSCVEIFESNPDSKQADLKQLGIIALTLASSKAAETSQYIKTLLLNKTLDPVVDQALSDCSDQYLDAVQQLGDASSELLEDGTKDVRASVKAGIAAAQSCENGFKESSGSEILVSRNAMFRQLCNNVLVINKLLEEK